MRVYTVINRAYLRLAEAWGESVRSASGLEPEFFCSDAESAEHLTQKGYRCHAEAPAAALSYAEKAEYAASSFPSDHAAYTVSLKFAAAARFLAEGEDCIFSDVDAIWLRDPMPWIEGQDADFAFQPASFPMENKRRWGFSVCTGFFYIRPAPATEALVKMTVDGFDGSDQRTLNRCLLHTLDVTWEKRPIMWEHGAESGWSKPIRGHCASSGLKLLALPHSYFQRHCTTAADVGHAVICHPNSEKDEAAKISILTELGAL